MTRLARAVLLSVVALPPASVAAQSQPSSPPNVRVRSAINRGPLRFEANRGQTDPRVRFLARGKGYTLFLTESEAVFRADGDPALRMTLAGARRPRRIVSVEPLPGRTNYLRGSDPRRWTTDVPSFAKVRYEDVYRGIDLVYYGRGQQLEYDFIVAPGAHPSTIRLRFAGAERLSIGSDGDLLLRSGPREARLLRPVAYQEVGSVRREIPAQYELSADGAVMFRVGRYDPAVSLTIDPVLVYSTYLGGSEGTSFAGAIATDSSGAAYVAGSTAAPDFPTTPGAFRETPFGGFVSKFDAGGALVYSTYLGGNGLDGTVDIAVSPAGEAVVVGVASGPDFPTTQGAFQRTCVLRERDFPGCTAGYVTKLNAAGSALVFSTYFGGDGVNVDGYGTSMAGVALDQEQHIYLTGNTSSVFPITPGAFQPNPTLTTMGFVTKMTRDGNALVYSSYLGGSGPGGDIPQDISVDRHGNVFVAGLAHSPDFPTTPGAVQPSCAAFVGMCWAGFVTKINAAGTAMLYSTYLGGAVEIGFPNSFPAQTHVRGIAVDQFGFAYVTGTTNHGMPTTAGSLKPATTSPDAFVAKLNLWGTGLVYSTYLGGDVPADAGDSGSSIAVDTLGNAYVAGFTTSHDFPQVNSLQPSFGQGPNDGFIAILNPSGSALTFSTYLGGGDEDWPSDLALDSQGDLLVAGSTKSIDFPVVNAVQPVLPGAPAQFSSFVSKIGGLSCGTEVTGQVDVLQGGFFPLFWPFNLQLVIVWNRTAETISGPLAYAMDDLQNAAFVGTSSTRCFSPEGDPVTVVPLGGDSLLMPNEARLAGLLFFQTQLAPIPYTPRLLSGYLGR